MQEISKMELERKVDNFGVQTKNDVEKKSKLLSTSLNQISNITSVSNSLDSNINDLNTKILELDPSKLDFSKIGNLFFDPIKKYFNKVERYDSLIGIIIENLEQEKNILKRDNITLGLEVDRLNEIITELEETEKEGEQFIEEIKKQINSLEIDGQTETANFYKNDILSELEKKIYDIREMIIVKQQSVMAIDIIRRNNKEIIRNIDRVNNVTIVALKTAVMVAKSIYNQKIVLKKINAIESSSGDIINSTGTVLEKHEEELFQNDKKKLLEESFNKVVLTINETSENNRITLPESSKKLVELKNMEVNNEGE